MKTFLKIHRSRPAYAQAGKQSFSLATRIQYLRRRLATVVLLLVVVAAFAPGEAKAQSATLSNFTQWSMELSVTGYAGSWWFKATGGAGISCTQGSDLPSNGQIGGLSANTSYTVSFYSNSGCTTAATGLSDVTATTPGLTASNITQTSATLTLSPGSTGLTALTYRQEWPTQGDCTPLSGSTTATVTVAPRNFYVFYAYRTTDCSTSPSSNRLAGVQFSSLGTPEAPTNLNATAYHESVTLSWTPRFANPVVTGYEYTRKVGSGSFDATWTDIGGSNASTTRHTFTGLTNGTAYEFKVRAVNSEGDGSASESSGAATPVAAVLTSENVKATSAVLRLRNWPGTTISYEVGTTCVGNSVQGTAPVTLVPIDGLTAATAYTVTVFTGTGCASANELDDVTFTTPAASYTAPTLSVKDIDFYAATLVLAGHTGDWWYGEVGTAECTQVSAGTTEATLSLTNPNHAYDYRAYGTAGCETASSLSWTADVTFNTTGTVQITFVNTQNSVTLTLSSTVGTLTGGWSYDYTNNTTGEASECFNTTFEATSTVTIPSLDKGTPYTINAYIRSDCPAASRITRDVTTTLLTAGSVTGQTASLQLQNHSGNWYHGQAGTQASGKRAGLASSSCSPADGATDTFVSNLEPGTNYTWNAYRSATCSSYSQIASVTFVTVSTPQLAVLRVVGTTATISMSNYAGNWWYDAALDGRKQVSCTPVASGTHTVNVAGLQAGSTYRFLAYNDGTCAGHAALGSPVDASTSVTVPAAPTHIAAAARDGSVILNWNSGGDGGASITGWQYTKKVGTGTFETAWSDISGSGPYTTSHTVSGLTNGTAYEFKVRARNQEGDGAASAATSAVTPRPNQVPAFTEAALADHVLALDRAISPIVLPAATGGNGAISYALTPSLPDGLDFNAGTRTIAGTTAAAHPATQYTYYATDEDGDRAEQTFSITVDADLVPRFVGVSVSNQFFIEGVAVDPVTLPAATGGQGDVTYAVTPALPAGLMFDADARTISGTPTVALPETEFTLTATDQNGEAAELTFALTVAADVEPTFAGAVVADLAFTQNRAIEAVTLPAAEAGNGVTTYALTPDLPEGLTFDAATRAISGTPTSEQSGTQYTYSATDEDGDTVELTFTLTVSADLMPTFAGASIGPLVFTEDSAIEPVTLPAAAGGDGSMVYTVTPDLPAGLTFDAATRTLSGVPTDVQAETQYTYTATDEDGDSAELTFSITVALDLMPTFAGAAITDQSYKQNRAIEAVTLPEAAGGDGAVMYGLTPDLPAGLMFDAATRMLSGTPSEPLAATQYTYTGTDEDGDEAALTFTITVAADLMPTFAGASVTDQSYKQNRAIEAVTLPAASGGDGVVSYDLSPDLPAGLMFDMSARMISGTPDDALPETQYTYTATDEDGDAESLTFAITVAPDLMPTFTGAAIANQSYKQNRPIEAMTLPAASGGDGPVTYNVSPDLPAGLTFDAAARSISGTPGEAFPETQYTYSAEDEDGDAASLTFAITVAPDLVPTFTVQSIANLQLRRGHVMAPVTLPEATGGDGALSYTLAPALPQGLSFDADSRELTGVPAAVSAPQTYTFKVTDSDLAAADEASLSFAIEVVISSDDREVLTNSLAAQGRALLTSTTATIGQRFRAPARETQGMASSALSSVKSWLSPMAQGLGPHAQLIAPRLGDLIRGSMFTLSSSSLPGNNSAVRPGWTLWTAADAQMYDGVSGVQAYEGGLTSVFVGGDIRFAGDWLAGAAVARSLGQADYSVESREGTLETQLNAVYPYISGKLTSSMAFWAIGGIGSGDAEDLSQHTGAQLESSSLAMRMAAVGLHQPLWRPGNLGVALVGAAGYLTLTTEDGSGAINGLDVGVTQVRLAMEVTRHAGSLAPYVRLGARGDGGDGDSGAGLEVVGGLNYTGLRVAFEAQGRWLAAHSAEDYREYGGMARFQVKARTDGSGFRLNLRPSWGATQSALLGGGGMPLGHGSMSSMLPAGGIINGQHAVAVESDLGYGIAMFDRGMLTLGARQIRYGGAAREAFGFGWESMAEHSALSLNSGLRFRLDYERPTAIAKGGPRMELNYAVRF